jgi:hypothetical protein
MALLQGPLFSLEARGAVGEALVYFPWKGRACVRKYLIPANPQDVDQKIIRQKLGAIGYAQSFVSTPSATLADGSALYKMIKDLTPADNIWNAYIVKTVIDYVKTDGNFTALSAALYATNQTANWIAAAEALGIEDLTGAAFATEIKKELILFMQAYGAYALGLCDATKDYGTHPSNWDDATISQFATDFTAAY